MRNAPGNRGVFLHALLTRNFARPCPVHVGVAQRMSATTVELDAGHLSLVSQADKVADLILAAAGQRE